MNRRRNSQIDPIIHMKIERLSRGFAPRLLELCSGCGGLSVGLKAAGFDLLAHVESDPVAAETYAWNLGPDHDRSNNWAVARDMKRVSPQDLIKAFGLQGSPSSHFDVLAAGLPCQAFARIGRSKLRSVGGDERAVRIDREIAGARISGLARWQRDLKIAAPINGDIVRVFRRADAALRGNAAAHAF